MFRSYLALSVALSTLTACPTPGPIGPEGPEGATGAPGAPGAPGGSGAELPPGTIVAFGGTAAPAGWLLCDGASYGRAEHPALYAFVGTLFGSTDANSFNVPDLRRRFPLGRAATGTGSTVGEPGGSDVHSHGLPNHTHPVPGHGHGFALSTTANGAHSHRPSNGSNFIADGNGNVTQALGTGGFVILSNTSTDGDHGHGVTGSIGSGVSGDAPFNTPATGGATSNSGGNLPPFMALNFMIKR